MDSYRVEKQTMHSLMLPDENAEMDPTAPGGGHLADPELTRLSDIVRQFNDHFGEIVCQDADRVPQLITETMPSRVPADAPFKNALKNSDDENPMAISELIRSVRQSPRCHHTSQQRAHSTEV